MAYRSTIKQVTRQNGNPVIYILTDICRQCARFKPNKGTAFCTGKSCQEVWLILRDRDERICREDGCEKTVITGKGTFCPEHDTKAKRKGGGERVETPTTMAIYNDVVRDQWQHVFTMGIVLDNRLVEEANVLLAYVLTVDERLIAVGFCFSEIGPPPIEEFLGSLRTVVHEHLDGADDIVLDIVSPSLKVVECVRVAWPNSVYRRREVWAPLRLQWDPTIGRIVKVQEPDEVKILVCPSLDKDQMIRRWTEATQSLVTLFNRVALLSIPVALSEFWGLGYSFDSYNIPTDCWTHVHPPPQCGCVSLCIRHLGRRTHARGSVGARSAPVRISLQSAPVAERTLRSFQLCPLDRDQTRGMGNVEQPLGDVGMDVDVHGDSVNVEEKLAGDLIGQQQEVSEIQAQSPVHFLHLVIEHCRRVCTVASLPPVTDMSWKGLEVAAEQADDQPVIPLLARWMENFEAAHPDDNDPGRLLSHGVLEYIDCPVCNRTFDEVDRVVCLDAANLDAASAYDQFISTRLVTCNVQPEHRAPRRRQAEGGPPAIMLFRYLPMSTLPLPMFRLAPWRYRLVAVFSVSQERCAMYTRIGEQVDAERRQEPTRKRKEGAQLAEEKEGAERRKAEQSVEKRQAEERKKQMDAARKASREGIKERAGRVMDELAGTFEVPQQPPSTDTAVNNLRAAKTSAQFETAMIDIARLGVDLARSFGITLVTSSEQSMPLFFNPGESPHTLEKLTLEKLHASWVEDARLEGRPRRLVYPLGGGYFDGFGTDTTSEDLKSYLERDLSTQMIALGLSVLGRSYNAGNVLVTPRLLIELVDIPALVNLDPSSDMFLPLVQAMVQDNLGMDLWSAAHVFTILGVPGHYVALHLDLTTCIGTVYDPMGGIDVTDRDSLVCEYINIVLGLNARTYGRETRPVTLRRAPRPIRQRAGTLDCGLVSLLTVEFLVKGRPDQSTVLNDQAVGFDGPMTEGQSAALRRALVDFIVNERTSGRQLVSRVLSGVEGVAPFQDVEPATVSSDVLMDEGMDLDVGESDEVEGMDGVEE